MLDRITSMQVFARVAALGSLSAAARDLGMSQTMATKHMAALEQRLGTKLLHRTTRRLSLTEAGRNYLESAERILAEIEEADDKVSRDAVEVRGVLRLNAPVSFGVMEIGPLLPELSNLYPELKIDLGLNDRFIDPIEEGWDLVIRIGALNDSTLVARRLAPCPIVLCAAPSYIKKHGRPKKVADLVNHKCLRYTLSRSASGDRWSFGKDGKTQVPITGPLKANNGEVMVASAVAGLGIVYQPYFLVSREIEAGNLEVFKLDQPTIELDGIFAVYPSDRRPPAKVRATIDFFAQRLGKAKHLQPRPKRK